MKVLIQRVSRASVHIENKEAGAIDRGLLLLVGFAKDDSEISLQPIIDKILKLRIFPSADGSSGFDLSVTESRAGILIVSQFTLYADCSRGRRPGFSEALAPQEAKALYDRFCVLLRSSYPDGPVAEGIFGADMKVSLENDGPVTIMLES